jgi:hypothetical protein
MGLSEFEAVKTRSIRRHRCSFEKVMKGSICRKFSPFCLFSYAIHWWNRNKLGQAAGVLLSCGYLSTGAFNNIPQLEIEMRKTSQNLYRVAKN